MSFDDPDHLECTCTHRALRADEAVLYLIPRGPVLFEKQIFAKDCPIHGYTVNPASEDAENS